LTRRQRISAATLAVIALCFLTLDLGGSSLSGAHSGVRGAMGSLYRGTDSVLGPVRRWVQGVPDAGTNKSRIDDLQRTNAAQRARIAQLEADARTRGELTALQKAADGSGHTLLPARVIAYGPAQGFDWTVTIDVGTRDGVHVDQTVTDGAGLVGRVLHADASSSVVLLAADPGSGVGARDVRSGELGVASGHGTGDFTFAPLRPTASVRVGDQLITGPNGASTFVSGLEIGTVTAVRTSADGSVTAIVRPATSPTALDLVAVVVKASTLADGRTTITPAGKAGN